MSVNDFYSFFFNDTATTAIYTLSLHDALPIYMDGGPARRAHPRGVDQQAVGYVHHRRDDSGKPLPRLEPRPRSEEHTSELQSRLHLVCRLLLEKKKKKQKTIAH